MGESLGGGGSWVFNLGLGIVVDELYIYKDSLLEIERYAILSKGSKYEVI